VAGIGADYPDAFFLTRLGAADDNAALVASWFDGGGDFHIKKSKF